MLMTLCCFLFRLYIFASIHEIYLTRFSESTSTTNTVSFINGQIEYRNIQTITAATRNR